MKNKRMTVALALVCALGAVPPLAMAQGHEGQGGGGDHGGGGGQMHGGGGGQEHGGGGGGQEHASAQEHGGGGQQHGGGMGEGGFGGGHGGSEFRGGPRGGGPAWWHNGGRLPDEYWRGNTYLVNDWYHYHLRRPPPGYQWRRINGDYVLVAISTGLILQIVYGARY